VPVIDSPTVIVAASATAILNDIKLSSFLAAARSERQIPRTPARRGHAILAHAFLAAHINQQVSASAPEQFREALQKKNFATK
jgi:hypothetical protein